MLMATLGGVLRKICPALVAFAGVAGIACQLLFQSPNGSVSDNGMMLIIFPSFAVLGFFAMKIYSIEAGEEDAGAAQSPDNSEPSE
jgi:hypothetical protein